MATQINNKTIQVLKNKKFELIQVIHPEEQLDVIDLQVRNDDGSLVYFTADELIEKLGDDSFFNPESIVNFGRDNQLHFTKLEDGYVCSYSIMDRAVQLAIELAAYGYTVTDNKLTRP